MAALPHYALPLALAAGVVALVLSQRKRTSPQTTATPNVTGSPATPVGPADDRPIANVFCRSTTEGGCVLRDAPQAGARGTFIVPWGSVVAVREDPGGDWIRVRYPPRPLFGSPLRHGWLLKSAVATRDPHTIPMGDPSADYGRPSP